MASKFLLKYKNMITLWGTIFGSIIVIIAAIVQYYEKKDAEKEALESKQKAAEYNSRFEKSQEDFTALQLKSSEDARIAAEKNFDLTTKVSSHTEGLLKDSEEARKIQEETIKFILGTGGGDIKFYVSKKNEYHPIVVNNTSYPIYDMITRISDWDEIMNCYNILEGNTVIFDDQCFNNNIAQESPMTIASFGSMKMNYTVNKGKGVKHFKIETQSRSQITVYFCVVEIDGAMMASCYRKYLFRDNHLEFISQTEEGIKIGGEEYWNDHFLADKIILTAAIKE